MLIEIDGKKPGIADGVFIAPNATIIGDVQIGEGSSVWYGAVIRGDLNAVRIGKHSNIQDNCTIHVDSINTAVIGDYVTVGHNAVLHGCHISHGCVIGLGSVILNGAKIGKGSIVAAGSVVREKQEIEENQLVAGSPAVFKKQLDPDSAVANRAPAEIYVGLAKKHILSNRR
jgi:carbonic anhydrase/acetyltransferase-like protein (isoleucine patch superfamily)